MLRWLRDRLPSVVGSPPSHTASCRPHRSMSLQVERLEEREVLSGFSQRFVAEAYEDVLRRTVDTAGLAYWSAKLDQGAPRTDVISGIAASDEYRTLQVTLLYRAYLGRVPDAAGLEFHKQILRNGGKREDVAASILGSAEYFQARGQGTEERFLQALYQDVLGREIDPQGQTFFHRLLTEGMSRQAAAGLMLSCPEAQRDAVRRVYAEFLHRPVEGTGLDYWGGGLQAGLRHEQVVAGVVGSEEYRTQVTRTDAVLDWNEVLLNAIRTDRTAPPRAARAMALMHAAVHDAVIAVTDAGPAYRVDVAAPAGASADAAAVAASYRVLVQLFPAQAGYFDSELALALAQIPDGNAKLDGLAVGRSVADQMLALRATDGASAVVPYTVGTAVGDWQPTPPSFTSSPALPQWPFVTPWAVPDITAYRSPAPPDLASPAYAEALDEVKELGRRDSATRTADQTQIAQFWADGAGTVTPPGHWNLIAAHQALLRPRSLVENARLFAQLNFALADAAISAWDTKYAFDLWRPVTAIHRAAEDGNDQTTPDASWAPLLVTPTFPTYTSGHSTFSGAAGEVLAGIFGTDVRFTDGSDDLPSVYRTFTGFAAAADEAGRSRIYGGIHFQFDNLPALAAGRAIGAYTLQNTLRGAVPSNPT